MTKKTVCSLLALVIFSGCGFSYTSPATNPGYQHAVSEKETPHRQLEQSTPPKNSVDTQTVFLAGGLVFTGLLATALVAQ